MRLAYGSALAVAVAMLAPPVIGAQDPAKPVAGGGVSIPGWTGKIDANEEKAGQTLNNAKLSGDAKNMTVQTGPAVNYWNPANTASGNYTVKATFTEPKFQNLNDHPHPYGIFIAGNDMGTENMSLLYCAAYGTGTFIVRGFGPAPFRMNGGRGEPNAAVGKAAGPGQPVKQEIAMSVKGDKVECAINGTVVGTYDKAALVTAGRLKSLDGVYGIRFAHNTEGIVTGFGMTKN
jgi:hypothetical protein